jgi:hypothetical protein
VTTERDGFDPAASADHVPAADATGRPQEDAQRIDRPLERDVQRDVKRDADRAAPQLQAADAAERAPLFEPKVLSEFNARWTDIQAGFVDEPRRAVQQADTLVSDVIQRVADSFGGERTQLEQQWDRGNDVSTEELRQTLQRYRSFFSRLLEL